MTGKEAASVRTVTKASLGRGIRFEPTLEGIKKPGTESRRKGIPGGRHS